jgi:hypothetical protein
MDGSDTIIRSDNDNNYERISEQVFIVSNINKGCVHPDT